MVSAGTLALVGVGAAGVASVALLVAERPPVNQLTVLATVPWMVVTGLLHVLAGSGAYPQVLVPLLRFPTVFVTAFVVGVLVWVPLLQLATLRDFPAGSGTYLAAAGMGVAVVLLVTLFAREGLDGRALLWLSATPVLAAMLAGTTYVLFGFVDATTLATTRWIGYLVVLAFTFLGTAVAVSVDVYGASPDALPGPLVAVSEGLPVGSASVAWPVIFLGAFVGVAVAALLARAIRADAVVGHLLAVAVGTLALGPGVARLLVTVLR